jgi:16S rRNA (uracil1498-N3)-methyltransferase
MLVSMRLHRFVIGMDLRSGKAQIDDSDVVHQWVKVLRLREGDTVILCDGKGSQAEAVIHELGKKNATVLVGEVTKVESEPQRKITLSAAIIKRENFEWIVEKATEAGVSEIIPIISARTMKTGLKMDRLRSIAKEAVEQCGRGVLPVIHEPMTFEEAMEKMKGGKNVFFNVIPSDFAERNRNEGCLVTLASRATRHDNNEITLWIGPEGGWTTEEVQHAKQKGAKVRSLGNLTLRAETAALVATYLAANDLL